MKYTEIKTAEDIKYLSKLAYHIWHEYWPCILSDEQINYMLNKFQSENAIKQQLEFENYIYYIIQDDKKNDIGYFGISIKDNYLFLSKLYITQEFRHKGYGKQIFEKIIELTKKYSKPSIRLTVNKYNSNTIKAYIKWGFKTIDSVVSDIGSGFVMDDYIMEYQL